MKRFVALTVVGVVLLGAGGCGGPDAVMREFIANLNLYAETLEKKEPREKQLAAQERVRTTVEKMDKLKLGAEERDKLFAKHEADLKKVKERIDAAYKALQVEGGSAAELPPDLFPGGKK